MSALFRTSIVAVCKMSNNGSHLNRNVKFFNLSSKFGQINVTVCVERYPKIEL